MIQPNELRIGNYVRYNLYPDELYTIRSVSADRLQAIGLIEQGNNTIYALSAESCLELEPIPLTPEILEKCGFVWHENIQHWAITWGKNWSYFIKKDDYYKGFSFELGPHRYRITESLHQLQNLYFALTGEELNIQL